VTVGLDPNRTFVGGWREHGVMFVQQISEKEAQGFRKPAFRLCDSLRSGILTLERGTPLEIT